LALREGWFLATSVTQFPDDAGWISVDLEANESAYWLFDLDQAEWSRVVSEIDRGQIFRKMRGTTR